VSKQLLAFSRADRYRTIWRTLPYIVDQGFRKRFRSTAPARSATATLTHPEFRRVVHDVYCAMFLRGYAEATGLQVDRRTGLLVVLFAVLMYVFDDEFEVRRRAGAATDVQEILHSAEVAPIWGAMGAYLRCTGHDDRIRDHIIEDFFGRGFDQYQSDICDVEAGGGLAATRRVVEFDSGAVLLTAHHLIRMFNRHPHNSGCAEQFRNLGLAGKYLDDLADYTDDVTSGSPNLLDAHAAQRPSDLAAARAAVAAGEPVTREWWQQHCPVTYQRYLDETFGYYKRVTTPRLRLPLDIYLTLLHTRRFWSVSTVRASRRV
jgi:hypothetical protein